MIEYIDHLHEQFRCPVMMQAGCYLPPEEPGYNAEIIPRALVA